MDDALRRRLDAIILLVTLVASTSLTATALLFGLGGLLIAGVGWLVVSSVVFFLLRPDGWYALGQKLSFDQ